MSARLARSVGCRAAIAASWLLSLAAAGARAEGALPEGLYVMKSECAAEPDSGGCAQSTTVCVARTQGGYSGTLSRRSPALEKNGVPANTAVFRLSDGSDKAALTLFYPVAGSECSPLRNVSARARTSVESAASIELSYDYQQLDLEKCEPGGESTVQINRYFKAATGDAACGATAETATTQAASAKAAIAERQPYQLPACSPGRPALSIEVIADANGVGRGLRLNDPKTKEQWTLSAASLARDGGEDSAGDRAIELRDGSEWVQMSVAGLWRSACALAGQPTESLSPRMTGKALDKLASWTKSSCAASDSCPVRVRRPHSAIGVRN